jgi:polysaccharide biosynthesis protein PslH
MRILFLSPRQCWPPRSGAKLREFHLAAALGRRAELTHVFFSPPGSESPGPADLPFAQKILAVPQPKGYTAGRILRGLFSKKWPLPILNYTSDAMMAALETTMRKQEFDLIHLDSIHMAAYVPMLSRAKNLPVIYDWHNIESEAMRRYSKHSPSVLRARYAAMTAGRLESLEDKILKESYGHLVCSQREREELLRRVPSARIAVIENGVDSGAFAETAAAGGERRRIVFVGWMAYHANAEAAIFFARNIWPGISRQFPQWTLTLVGLDPTPVVRALHGSGNIEVTGTVPDVRPYYAEAVAALVPLRVGGGTRLKILEAMAAGVPVISTALGAEGLAVSPGRDLLIADRDEDWLAHLQTLVQNSGMRRELVAAGRALVCERYDWQVLGRTLYETYAEWLKTPL